MQQRAPSTLLSGNSARVKAIAFHPSKPLLLTALHTGKVQLWNFASQTLVSTIDVSDKPVRAVQFLFQSGKELIVSGSDDCRMRVHDLGSLRLEKDFVAHDDYVRSLSVHATLPLLLSTADDKLVKIWDTTTWTLQGTYSGHTHYVMQGAWNPTKPNSFATAGLDGTVRLWVMGRASEVLQGHQRGVNCVAFGVDGALVSGADDGTVRLSCRMQNAPAPMRTAPPSSRRVVTNRRPTKMLSGGRLVLSKRHALTTEGDRSEGKR